MGSEAKSPASRQVASGPIWALRILVVVGLVLLCALADSPAPSWAFALTWGPNGLLLVAFERGALQLPRSFERVHPIEPRIYRWLGIGWIKLIVATPTWPRFMGVEPPQRPATRHELLMRTELATKGSEVCHGVAFILSLVVALAFAVAGRVSVAAWIMGFNVLLNGYPVMLQRANRWRVQEVRRLQSRHQPEHAH